MALSFSAPLTTPVMGCSAAVWWTLPVGHLPRKVHHLLHTRLLLTSVFSVLLTDLHYEDLSLYGAASVTLSRMDQETCSEAVCEEEVASNIGKICNGTSQKYANKPSRL